MIDGAGKESMYKRQAGVGQVGFDFIVKCLLSLPLLHAVMYVNYIVHYGTKVADSFSRMIDIRKIFFEAIKLVINSGTEHKFVKIRRLAVYLYYVVLNFLCMFVIRICY